MTRIVTSFFILCACLMLIVSCFNKQGKASTDFYALGFLGSWKEYITTDSSIVYNADYIKMYIYLNGNDSLFLVRSDKETDSLFSIKSTKNDRAWFKQQALLFVGECNENPLDSQDPCCLHPFVSYAKNDSINSSGFVSGCAIQKESYRTLGRLLNPTHFTFVSETPSFQILEKRYLMEGILKMASFRSKRRLLIQKTLKFKDT